MWWHRARNLISSGVSGAVTLCVCGCAPVARAPDWAGLSDVIPAVQEPDSRQAAMEFLSAEAASVSDEKDVLGAAVASLVTGEILENERKYQDALSWYESGLDRLSKGRADIALDVSQLLGRIQAFEKSYEGIAAETPGSLDLYRGQADSRELAGMHEDEATATLSAALAMNAGNMYLLQSQLAPANEYYREAAAAAVRANNRLVEAQALSNLAWSAIRSGRYDDADRLLTQTMSRLAGGSEALELRKAVLAVGVNARESGNVDLSESTLRAALQLYDEAGDKVGYGRVLAHLGSTLLLEQRYEQARDAYQAALVIGEELADDEILRHAHGGLARTYQSTGNTRQAVDEYAQYFDLLGAFLTRWSTDQGRVAIIQNEDDMLAAYASAAGDLARDTGDFTPLRNAVRKIRGSALACLIQSRQQRPSRTPGHIDGGPLLYGSTWDYVQVEYASAINTATPVNMAAQQTIDVDLRAGTATLDLGERCAVPDSAAEPGPDTPPMIEYYVAADRLVILVILGGEVRGATVPVGRSELGALIDDYLRAIDADRPRGITVAGAAAGAMTESDTRSAIAQRLYEVLITPVAAHLPEAADARLVIVPDNDLWRLPFAALEDARGRYLGDRFRLSYIPSADAWSLLEARPRPANAGHGPAWVVGNPAMPRVVESCGEFRLSGLPGADREARAVAAILGADDAELFTGDTADLMRLDAWHGNYSVIHLAAHGVACGDDPLSSFIALAELHAGAIEISPDRKRAQLRRDPRLGVELDLPFDPLQIPQVPTPSYPALLTARRVIDAYTLNADLVTLSTCQSGLGLLSGEGMIGFARAFLGAGARSLVVSLWKVDDDATTALMTRFYEAYVADGDKGRALQRAMQTVRSDFPDPRDWAGFVLLGLQQ